MVVVEFVGTPECSGYGAILDEELKIVNQLQPW
jgi:hypothetical protein